jgi:acyl-CoA synthetase (AMP-forming)/AMP-acid ligase II
MREMRPIDLPGETLLEVFLGLATSDNFIDRDAVSCAGETWTYGDLNTISSGLAKTLGQRYGPRPTVALISENHPYVLALVLAIWKLGGIVAPLDRHAPSNLMEGMLRNVAPTFVTLFSSDVHNVKLVQGKKRFSWGQRVMLSANTLDLNIPAEVLQPGETTITDLAQEYLHFDVELPSDFSHPPNPEDISFYIHTSSASSVSNLKCVPVSHYSLITNGRSQLEWFRKTYPDVDFRNIRTLGWSPFSHIMSFCFDFGTSVLLTAGTYIFAVVPTIYGALAPEMQEDLSSVITNAIITEKPDAFAGVPWIVGSFMSAWNNEQDVDKKTEVISALKNFKYIISAGAATSDDIIEWASEHELNLLVSIGMTELGGALFCCCFCLCTAKHSEGVLFHSQIKDLKAGWLMGDSCIGDAVFTLVDDNGDIAETGSWICLRLIKANT